jgi:hypothetical protein
MTISFTHTIVSEALSRTHEQSCAAYMDALADGLRNVEPNFATDAYRKAFRERATDRDWFSSLLASNLYMEGYSAGRLKQYSGVVTDDLLRRDLSRHAVDEARHSRQFHELLFLTFPHLDTVALRLEAEENVVNLDTVTPCPPDYPAPSAEEVLHSLILLNLFEIKALFLGNFLKPFVEAHAPAAHKDEARTIISTIAADECHHIAYTARHLTALVRSHGRDEVAELISGFIEQMNSSDDFHF